MAIYTIPVAYSIWFVGLFDKYSKIIDSVPTEDHDVVMDSLFTPENYISISIE